MLVMPSVIGVGVAVETLVAGVECCPNPCLALQLCSAGTKQPKRIKPMERVDIVTKGLAYTKRTFRYSSNKGARGLTRNRRRPVPSRPVIAYRPIRAARRLTKPIRTRAPTKMATSLGC